MRVGFIGFGEVASVFAAAMRERGAQIAAYDAVAERRLGARTLAELIGKAGYVLSTVTTQAAPAVAKEAAAHLQPGQTYVDLNSTSPGVKQVIARLIEPCGADFVEGAILGAVGTSGAATEILLGGPKAEEAAAALRQLGLCARFYSAQIGRASMFKMLRSIFSKGLEALLVELLIAARRAGISEDLWRDVAGFMTSHPFEAVAANWIRTHAVAHQRRYHEMAQVLETLRELSLDAPMTAATAAFFQRSCGLGLAEAFAEKPGSMETVIDFMERQLAQRR